MPPQLVRPRLASVAWCHGFGDIGPLGGHVSKAPPRYLLQPGACLCWSPLCRQTSQTVRSSGIPTIRSPLTARTGVVLGSAYNPPLSSRHLSRLSKWNPICVFSSFSSMPRCELRAEAQTRAAAGFFSGIFMPAQTVEGGTLVPRPFASRVISISTRSTARCAEQSSYV